MDKKDYTYLLIIEKALIKNNVKIFLKSKKKNKNICWLFWRVFLKQTTRNQIMKSIFTNYFYILLYNND